MKCLIYRFYIYTGMQFHSLVHIRMIAPCKFAICCTKNIFFQVLFSDTKEKSVFIEMQNKKSAMLFKKKIILTAFDFRFTSIS
jgi:hypothetical protein